MNKAIEIATKQKFDDVRVDTYFFNNLVTTNT